MFSMGPSGFGAVLCTSMTRILLGWQKESLYLAFHEGGTLKGGWEVAEGF